MLYNNLYYEEIRLYSHITNQTPFQRYTTELVGQVPPGGWSLRREVGTEGSTEIIRLEGLIDSAR
jgi:hypothetical protein